ncbi:MAG: alpha-galactosidase [Clostridiales bacterium]|nr:alpha-galactosidase [Clostridiales bacterium]
MDIIFHQKEKIFQINTENTSYLMAVADERYLGHLYYGKRMEDYHGFYLLRTEEKPFVPSINLREKSAFLDAFPQEYSTWGVGDYRESCLNVRNSDGCLGCELLFDSYRIIDGKPALKGLPATFCGESKGKTLEITCVDPVLSLKVILRYSIFEDSDAIARSAEIINESGQILHIEKALSACLDMDNEAFDMITLNGSWGRERRIVRRPASLGRQSAASVRGESSHQEHPFMALVTPGTDQTQGEVYAMHFVYSGNFMAMTEVTQFDSLRMVMGIHPDNFDWELKPGNHFQTPEVIMVYSDEGLGKMTRTYHDVYRNHLIRSPYLHRPRPILINNWEATYFDFDSDKLLDIAREAKKAGIEMLVMDDGWFGHRDNDDSSLGDWFVNENKIKGGLKKLVDDVQSEGLLFGLWFEPEMISPDSLLYKKHPEWVISIPGRVPTQIRCQYVLDLSRPEVVDYAYEAVASILRSADISYVKWDMNRQLCDIGSTYLNRKNQGELLHRYTLGVYKMQERLITEFPNLLLENCSGGGARFDPGMLYYSPQIWCSDDTDAIERLAIQEGTALVYPLSVMGAHVSDCPNHAVGRVTPFATRGHVALAGTFGYELDITKISDEDRAQVKLQTAMYHQYNDLIREGDYFRIASWQENHLYDCWQVVSKQKDETLVTYVQVLSQPNFRSRKIKLAGLDPKGVYKLEDTGKIYSGEMLMNAGFLIQRKMGDFISDLYHFKQINC